MLAKYKNDIDQCVSEEDAGIYHAMNNGLELASGYYVIFLNSDDWYKRYVVEELATAAIVSDADITHSNAVLVNDSDRVIGRL